MAKNIRKTQGKRKTRGKRKTYRRKKNGGTRFPELGKKINELLKSVDTLENDVEIIDTQLTSNNMMIRNMNIELEEDIGSLRSFINYKMNNPSTVENGTKTHIDQWKEHLQSRAEEYEENEENNDQSLINLLQDANLLEEVEDSDED